MTGMEEVKGLGEGEESTRSKGQPRADRTGRAQEERIRGGCSSIIMYDVCSNHFCKELHFLSLENEFENQDLGLGSAECS